MTTQFDFDRRMTDFPEEAAAPRVPDYFDELPELERSLQCTPIST